MKNSIIGFILLSLLSFEVSAYGYGNPNTPPPPPPQQGGHYNNGHYQGSSYDNRYFKFSLGSGSVSSNDFFGADLTYKTTGLLPLTLGMGVERGPIAFEGELVLAGNEIDTVDGFSDSGSVSAFGLNGNVLFRAMLPSAGYLYAGVGVGTLAVSIDDGNFNSASGSSLSVQGMLGAELRPTQRVGLFIEYKLLTSLLLDLEDDANFVEDDFKYTNSSLNIGLRSYF